MSSIQNWTDTFNIETVAGSKNVYPKKYIINMFGKCLSSEAIKVLENQNQLDMPENMLAQLLQITTRNVSWNEFKKSNKQFLCSLDYTKDDEFLIYDFNSMFISRVPSNFDLKMYHKTEFKNLYRRLTSSDAIKILEMAFAEEKTAEQTIYWLENHSSVCFALDKKYVIRVIVNKNLMYHSILTLDHVKKTQPLFPLIAHESGNVYYADPKISTDVLREIALLS